MYESSSNEDIQAFWEVLELVDPSLTREDTKKKDIENKLKLKEFYQHCCRSRHYFFSIKKCGEETCEVCKPLRMPKEEFANIKHLPDPTIGDEDHYLTFEMAFQKETTEKDRPSLAKPIKRRKSLPFTPSVQHVRNIGLMLQCEECDLWRLLYSKRKLSVQEKTQLQAYIDDITYTCGATLQELDLPESFSCVFVREHNCFEPIEKLYYSANLEPICIYCAAEVQEECSDVYPMCDTCSSEKEHIRKRQ